ncbi:MAG TPA: glycosyltransferase family 2 protein [Phnomibacter sp.]|nr:glycosyltransferase family 2 protein [Phnomibacter sp.]
MMPTEVSVIIVAYRSSDLVNNCIASVIQFTKSVSIEIIVVDNAAGTNEAFNLQADCGSVPVSIIKMPYNAGFARANNQAFKVARGQALLLLNPDTELVSDAIGICFHALMSGSAVACGTQLIFADGTFQMSGWHFTTGNLGFFLKLPYLKKLYDKIRRRPAQLKVEGNEPREVDWINGAFLMVKASVVERCGGLDEEFFLYAEEPELCARIGRAGKLVVYPFARVVHHVGGVTSQAFESDAQGYFYIFDKRGLQMMVSELLRTRKQHGIGWLLFHYVIFFLYIPVFWMLNAVDFIWNRRAAAYGRKELWGYTRNTWKAGYYVWRILQGKPFFYKVL